MNQYIPLMDLNSSTQKIYERYLGSVVVVISMNRVLSLNNNGAIILSSFTLLLYVSMKFCGILDISIIQLQAVIIINIWIQIIIIILLQKNNHHYQIVAHHWKHLSDD